jgi:hypothetical protein
MRKLLATYTVRDLQHFNHLLQRFEGVGAADLPTIKRMVQGEIDREVSLQKGTRLKNKTYTPPEQVPPVNCPQCGFLMDFNIIENLPIMACKKCRYSEIKKEVGNGL